MLLLETEDDNTNPTLTFFCEGRSGLNMARVNGMGITTAIQIQAYDKGCHLGYLWTTCIGNDVKCQGMSANFNTLIHENE